MKKILLLALCLCLKTTFAQTVEWANRLSLENVLSRAKIEDKLIFVELRATWCAPCHKMEDSVFTNASVVKTLNNKFVPVFIQVDSLPSDGPDVRRWRHFNLQLSKLVHITSLPTFLFLNSAGEPVHQVTGYFDYNDFLKVLADAEKPSRQFYQAIKKLRQKEYNNIDVPYIIKLAQEIDTKEADSISNAYVYDILIKRYVGDLSGDDIRLMASRLKVNDPIFKLFSDSSRKVDNAVGESNYSHRVLKEVISRDLVLPNANSYFKRTHHLPVWKKIYEHLANHYDKQIIADAIVESKLSFYRDNGDWANYSTAFIEKVQKSGFFFPFPGNFKLDAMLNYCAWEIFLHSNDKKQLAKALVWSKKSIILSHRKNGEYFDTAANLLYKLGDINSAKSYEANAIALFPKRMDLKENLKKMNDGKKTW